MDMNPPALQSIHHAAIICSDYERSKAFYTGVLGLPVVDENYREARGSWKLDLALPGGGRIELFSFPDPPPRPSRPEACGHLSDPTVQRSTLSGEPAGPDDPSAEPDSKQQ
jgi:catechol 2,3-dioxygenase-like lactoylglutathione lyase family enzyme